MLRAGRAISMPCSSTDAYDGQRSRCPLQRHTDGVAKSRNRIPMPCRFARFGVIDRRIDEPPCARRCRRTNGTSLGATSYGETTCVTSLLYNIKDIIKCENIHLALRQGDLGFMDFYSHVVTLIK